MCQVEGEWLRQYHFQLDQLPPDAPLSRYWAPRICHLLSLWAQLEWLMALWISILFGSLPGSSAEESRRRQGSGPGDPTGVCRCCLNGPQAGSRAPRSSAEECDICARWEIEAGACQSAIALLRVRGLLDWRRAEGYTGVSSGMYGSAC